MGAPPTAPWCLAADRGVLFNSRAFRRFKSTWRSPRRRRAVQKALSRFRAFEQPFIQAGRTPPPSGQLAWHLAREAAHAQEVTRTSQEITEVLTSRQQRRLAEISLQDQGAEGLFQPEIVTALELTPTQQRSLARLRQEADRLIAARLGRPRGPDGRPLGPAGAGASRTGAGTNAASGVNQTGVLLSPVTGITSWIRPEQPATGIPARRWLSSKARRDSAPPWP